VFSKPDRETGKYGVAFSQGSSGVMVSQSSISNIWDDPTSFYREQRFDSKAWLGVRDLFKSFGNPEDSLVGYLLPTSVWVGYGEGNVKSANPSMPTAGLVDASAGMGWQWQSLYANFGVWRSVQSGPQLATNLSTRASSEGGDLSLGVKRDKWYANAYVSMSRSSYDDALNNFNSSNNYNTSGGVSFTFIMDRLPNVTLAFDISKYGDTYLAFDGADSGRTTTAGVALDFSKYFVQRSGQKLQLFYYARDEAFDSRWSLTHSHSLTLAHVFGGVVRSRW
jgi:hypothetical protein